MKVDHKPTQNERITDYIHEFGSITQPVNGRKWRNWQM